MYHGKDHIENFIEDIEDEAKQLYTTLLHSPISELTDVLEKEQQAAKKCHICLKELNNPKNR